MENEYNNIKYNMNIIQKEIDFIEREIEKILDGGLNISKKIINEYASIDRKINELNDLKDEYKKLDDLKINKNDKTTERDKIKEN